MIMVNVEVICVIEEAFTSKKIKLSDLQVFNAIYPSLRIQVTLLELTVLLTLFGVT